MRRPLTSCGATVLAVLAAHPAVAANTKLGPSCDLEPLGGTDKQEFLRFDRELRDALAKRDAVAASFLVQFPLRLNYADGSSLSLNNAAALQKRFAEVFNERVVAAIRAQKPDEIHCMDQGILYGHGELWADYAGEGAAQRYRVVVVNLPAPPGVGAGPSAPTPEFICDAEKHRVVVDKDAKGTWRYRAWDKPRPLTDPPSLVLAGGKVESEGTGRCRYSWWTFGKGTTEISVSELGCTEGKEPAGARGTLDVSVGGKVSQHWYCF